MVGSQPWRSQPRVPPKLVVAKVALTGGTGFLDSKIAVKEGLYTPLGQGDVDVTAIIGALLGPGAALSAPAPFTLAPWSDASRGSR